MARQKKLTPSQLTQLANLRKAADTSQVEAEQQQPAKEAETTTLTTERYTLPAVDNSGYRLLGSCPSVEDSRQSPKFDIPITKQFATGDFPHGAESEYPGANGSTRMTQEEYREKDRLASMNYDMLRQAAEVHRQTRRYMHDIIKPGLTTLEIAQTLEAKSAELISKNGIEAGWAFPTGLSLNNCAAHYTPNYGEDPVVLKHDDIMKVDFGVHVKGHLVDSAWTVCFDEKFDPLVEATKDATNTGLKNAGIDMRLGELGALIQEVIESYEVEIESGKPPTRVKPVRNLSGHSIEPYRIHAGKSVPIVATDERECMEEGEVYAIETFASTGVGKVHEEGPSSHYMLDYNFVNNIGGRAAAHNASAQALTKLILKNHNSLAFCRRWLDDAGAKRHLLALKSLEAAGNVVAYPPLCDVAGSYTSQMEHTIILRPTCREIISRGDDY